MPDFRITLDDDSGDVVTGADTYQQEGPMTTFFATGAGRQTVDSWSTRLASFRTARIVAIRRVDPRAASRSEAPEATTAPIRGLGVVAASAS